MVSAGLVSTATPIAEPTCRAVLDSPEAWPIRANGTASRVAKRLNMGVNDVAAMDQLIFVPEPLGPVELGNRLGMRSASATALVDRLERAGHLRRDPHPSDRRRQTLAPTEHAIAEVAVALRPLIEGVSAAASELTPCRT